MGIAIEAAQKDSLSHPLIEHGHGAIVVEMARSIRRDVYDLEAFPHLTLAELGSTLIALVGVFVEHGTVMSSSILAAFDHK